MAPSFIVLLVFGPNDVIQLASTMQFDIYLYDRFVGLIESGEDLE